MLPSNNTEDIRSVSDEQYTNNTPTRTEYTKQLNIIIHTIIIYLLDNFMNTKHLN